MTKEEHNEKFKEAKAVIDRAFDNTRVMVDKLYERAIKLDPALDSDLMNKVLHVTSVMALSMLLVTSKMEEVYNEVTASDQ